ncbi:phosphatidylinositol-specific phospholipase c, X domain-containing protein [Sarocladium implicatum]|nr:phosphatidylinositol-specific phospholipase c, X domain-containing protein [Sarocladium implicatum]
MTPDMATLTNSSSIQASPEIFSAKDDEFCPPSFQLPESIISRKTSSASLRQSLRTASQPPSETPPIPTPKGGIIRRISSRASRTISSRRRQSSAAPPASRDASVGPCIFRRRSDSNTTAPPEYAPTTTDSESDPEERDEIASLRIFGFEDVAKELPLSQQSTSGAMAGPVIPFFIQQGTRLRKVSKKSRSKRICLAYEPETNTLVWDKSRPNKSVHVDEIKEIRTGSDVQQYAIDCAVPDSERTGWFSIIYGDPIKRRTKLMHLIADDLATCDAWIKFLDAMLKYRQEMMTSLMSFKPEAVAEYWQRETLKQSGGQRNSDETGELDLNSIKRVCSNLHIYSSQSALEDSFGACDLRRRNKLNFDEFLAFVSRLKQRRDVQRIIRSVAVSPEIGLTFNEFLRFLREFQKEDVSDLESWKHVYRTFACKDSTLDLDESVIMTEPQFVSFLSSVRNGPLEDLPQTYRLDRPASDYFISSSHNTYLLGRQFIGESSVEGYIAALGGGCRCVEVDCWDGSDGQPLVVHGRTLTTAINFGEVMRCINKYAFVRSQEALWISLEVHCNPAQQAIMAHTIRETFGARLVTEPLPGRETSLPTPDELKGRVLIKVKKPRDDMPVNEPTGRRRGNSLNSPLARPSVSDAASFLAPSQSLPQSPLLSPSLPGRRLVGKSRVNTIAEGEVPDIASVSTSTSDNESGNESASSRRSANKTVPVLGQLGVYCAGLKFQGFDTPEAKTFNHIFSFMESSFARHSQSKEKKMALEIHNMRYLMRVYPDGIRLGSTNFDPIAYWRRGVQMAAVNWQTFDLGMQLNRAMFQGGVDQSGYVLKPPELRGIQVGPYNHDVAECGKKERSVVAFNIDVLSAQQLMRPANLPANKSMDPYIEVEVFHANDKRDKTGASNSTTHELDSPLKYQTEVIRENGFNPMFIDGHFHFRVTTQYPELVFVRWSVKLSNDGESYSNKDRASVATFTAKLCNLKEGYRTLPLLNHTGEQYLFSRLFCKITKEPIVKTMVDAPKMVAEAGKLNRLGKAFGRINTSPRTTVERTYAFDKTSLEKSSFES